MPRDTWEIEQVRTPVLQEVARMLEKHLEDYGVMVNEDYQFLLKIRRILEERGVKH